jgi:hypothetical protein
MRGNSRSSCLWALNSSPWVTLLNESRVQFDIVEREMKWEDRSYNDPAPVVD